MADPASLTLCLLLMQRTAYPAPDPKPEFAWTASSYNLAEIKPQVIGRCPVHGDLGRGALIVFFNPDGSRRTEACLRCLVDLLKRVLPPVEKVP